MKPIMLSCMAIALAFGHQTFAQLENYAMDGLLFSSTNFGGTARSMGLAGAQTALGADLSSASNNPAGLGMCRKSEFTFTPMFGYGNSTSSFFSNNSKGNYTNLALGNLGAIFSFAKDDLAGGKWRGGSIAISMTRIKDFNNSISFNGTNNDNSMTQYFIESANGINDQIFLDEGNNSSISSIQSLAYNTYVINPIIASGDTKYQTLNDMQISSVNQSGYINTKGRINEWNIAGGVNYDDKLYFGGSLGIMGLYYEEDKSFSENIVAATPLTTTSFTLQEGRIINGAGIKISGGIIGRPNDFMKVGLSFSTPTIYSIDESFKPTTMTSTIANNVFYPGESTPLSTKQSAIMGGGTNNYTLTTPGIVTLGIALNNKNGLITTEFSSVNYSGVNIQDPNNPLTYSNANNFSSNYFKSTFNAKIGAEWRIDDFRIRGGYAYYGDPTKGIDNTDRSKNYFTLGAGYRINDYFVDIAYINSLNKTVYSPYSLKNTTAPVVKSQNSNTNIVVSCGIFF